MNNNWCIKGCEELKKYFGDFEVPLSGGNGTIYYYKRDDGLWDWGFIGEKEVITFQEYIDTYEFKLPEKWCVRVEENSKPSEVAKWRPTKGCGAYWDRPGYIHYDGYYSTVILDGSVEITLEQFRKHVLSNKINKKEMNIKQSQTLTRAQLLELHKKFECGEWKKEIENIVKLHPLASDDYDITIPQSAIEKLRYSGSVSQKSAAISAGIVLDPYKGVQLKQGNMFTVNDNIILERREKYEYEGEAFWLDDEYNWEIKRDSNLQLVLIPTTK